MKHLWPITLLLLMSLGPWKQAQAKMDRRVKSMIVMSSYGAVGGGLLGLASMAFGAKPRWVAKGASLGLYAGIFFGGYVILSHSFKSEDSYDDDDEYEQRFSKGLSKAPAQGPVFLALRVRF